MQFAVFNVIPLLLAITFLSKAAVGQDGPIVKTNLGLVQGGVSVSRDGRNYYQFLGIPYGTAKRFGAPKRAKCWNGTRDATASSTTCYQKTIDTDQIVGDEDCLVVNVYTPALPAENLAKLPVMVWIHGGSFWSGAGIYYNPLYLMDEDVVIVSINYRVGPFGFFNLGIKEAAGNQAGKDAVLALKWVRNNIAAFNGDRKRVTIFGESSGAELVSQLLISPLSQGLFAGAILQSGTCTSGGTINPRPKYYARLVASKLNCTDAPLTTVGTQDEAKQIIKCLQSRDKADVLNAINGLVVDWDNEAEAVEVQYTFSVEDHIEGVDAFLSKHPTQVILDGNYTKVPVISGVTAMESYYFYAYVTLMNARRVDLMNTEWNRVAPILFKYYHYNPDAQNASRNALSQRVKDLYFGNTLFNTDLSALGQMEKGLSDRLFTANARYDAMLLAQKNPSVYLYFFDKVMNGNKIPATHGEDLAYFWNATALGFRTDQVKAHLI